jgi:iron complex outermembrane receptor protein
MTLTRSTRIGLVLVLSLFGITLAAAEDAVDTPSAAGSPAPDSSAASSGNLAEIVVTAQKRSERVNEVPLTIQVIGGDELAERGIRTNNDLAGVVPGLNYTLSSYGTPVYTLRGVGFYDTALGASSTVAVYVDEVPLPFSVETTGAPFDLERVEVLKGPQGTLYGLNSTGGAINYIAAKPTKEFSTGGSVSYGRFNSVDLESFVSGPITSTLSARLAVMTSQSGPWQQSTTRDAQLGSTNLTKARFILDWNPDDQTRISFNANGFLDRSDTEAGQLIYVNGPPAAVPAVIFAQPIVTSGDRNADWTANTTPSRHDEFSQLSLRAERDITDTITAVSITNYTKMNVHAHADPDGTAVPNFDNYNYGSLRTYGEEFRLQGDSFDRRLHWIAGANYANDVTNDQQLGDTAESSLPFSASIATDLQHVKTYAGFGNLDFKVTDQIKLFGGVRYTDQKRHFDGCVYDSGNGELAAIISGLASFTSGTPVVIPPGGCITLGANGLPAVVHSDLNQDNVSWRGGVDYQLNHDLLFYVSVSRGYKNGSYPTAGAIFYLQDNPAVQESVTDYEAGFKATLFNDTVQLNAAGFYYDYRDKQIRGRFVDIFGAQSALVNIPQSQIIGAEAEIHWRPTSTFQARLSGTYIDSRVDRQYTNYDSYGNLVNFGGEAFPLTPKTEIVGDLQKDFPVAASLTGFVGANAKYQTSTNAALGDLPEFYIRGYTLVDLRGGVRNDASQWSLYGWVRNVGDVYYWNSVVSVVDTTVRYAGMPRTYGASFTWKF